MRTEITAALVVALLLGVPAAAAAPAGTSSAPTPGPADGAVAATTDADAIQLSTSEYLEIQIRPDGDARILLGTTLPAENDTERAAFQRTAESFEDGEYDLGYSHFEAILPDVEASADRSMSLSEPTYNASIDGGTGVLEQQFTWRGFARDRGGELDVSEAFLVGDAVWLNSLNDGQQLILRSPSGYSVAESPSGPEINDGALVWTGPVTFSPSDFSVSFEPDPASGSSGSDGVGGAPLWIGLAVLLIALILAVLVVLARRRDGSILEEIGAIGDGDTTSDTTAGGSDQSPGDDSVAAGDDDRSDPASDEPPTPEPTDDEPPTPAAESDASVEQGSSAAATSQASTGGENADAGGEQASAALETDVDPELLSDEERVRQLLERNGGRMKQANIVKETGWSNAKVSQLLSRMDEDDEVDKLRIGRENLISLPDVDVTDGQ